MMSEVEFSEAETAEGLDAVRDHFRRNPTEVAQIFACLAVHPEEVFQGKDVVLDLASRQLRGLAVTVTDTILLQAWKAGLVVGELQEDGDPDGDVTDAWMAYRLDDSARWEVAMDGVKAWLGEALR